MQGRNAIRKNFNYRDEEIKYKKDDRMNQVEKVEIGMEKQLKISVFACLHFCCPVLRFVLFLDFSWEESLVQ